MSEHNNPSNLIYCDTDSVIYVYDNNSDALGDFIKEIVVGGAKAYSYVTDKGKIVVKQKGITLDRANSNTFTFEKVKSVVLNCDVLQSEKRHQFVWVQTTKDVERDIYF